MKKKLPKQWQDNLKTLDIAFQPILDIKTGKTLAVEALLRNYQEIGFKSIFSLFDTAYKDNILYTFDLALRKKTIKKFTTIQNYQDLKLFYNLDNRLFEMPDFSNGNTNRLLKKYGVKKENICFEISERHEISGDSYIEKTLRHYKDNDFCIAIDDFGVGYSGYKLLYDTTPNIIKIDRFFLNDIEKDAKKKLMVRSITHLAIQLGIKVVAEGVETKEELLTCKEIGCHLVQGYLIQRPDINTNTILEEYQSIVELVKNDQRTSQDNYHIKLHLDKIKAIEINTKMDLVIEYFKKNKDISILPIVNSINEPCGILQEAQLKNFLYSQYGRSLLLNNDSNKSKLKAFIKPCAIAEINSKISTIIELFSNSPESVGIIITKNNKYFGFLSARAIISIMNTQNLIYAREQNPLTKLPGNMLIEKFIKEATLDDNLYIMCYFDLDNFKAFNDVYGFRNGDRVIQLFADILKKHLPTNFFNAHIGGDDFFTAVQYDEFSEDVHIKHLHNIIKKFTDDVKDFYSREDREQGYIVSKDRDENTKNFPLLTVSASILIINKNTRKRCLKNINTVLSKQKKVAKCEEHNLSMSSLL